MRSEVLAPEPRARDVYADASQAMLDQAREHIVRELTPEVAEAIRPW